MKKLLQLGLLIAVFTLQPFANQLNAQIVITEISYNPPESGADSTEFIELYNNGGTAVNLNGYNFTQGVGYTFPNITLNAGDYLVVAVDSVAINNRFGYANARQWTSGGLSNSGEDIILVDNMGNTVDSVDFDDNLPWPIGPPDPDGAGPSIVLCDPNADNSLASNWTISTDSAVGGIVNGNQAYGSPGAADFACPSSGINVMITVNSDVSCNGGNDGSATASASGGTAPYTYSWSNTGTTAANTGLSAGSYTVTVTDNLGGTGSSITTITEPMIVGVSAMITDVSCNGGSDGAITVTTSGGVTPYTYLWSTTGSTPTITGLAAGNYTVTVTDANGCDSILVSTVGEPASVQVSMNVDSTTSCNNSSDGGATAIVNGGTSPYTYNWSNGATTASITGISIGTYTVTVTDANTCTQEDSVAVGGPMPLSISFSVDTVISCFGGSNGAISAIINGGTSPYIFQWNSGDSTNNRTSLSIGTYVLTVTDTNGCSITDSISLTEPAEIITNENDVACDSYTWAQNGMTYTISGTYDDTLAAANGCDSIIRLSLTIDNSTSSSVSVTSCFSYTWPQNGMTYTQSGTYSHTLTGANSVGCDSIIDLNLTISIADVTVIRNGLDLIALANGGSPTFQWIDCGNGDTAITAATSNVFTIPENGFYAVIVTQNGCTDTSVCVNVINIGIGENKLSSENLNIYPNPTSREFTFEIIGAENHQLGIAQIFDLTGELVKEIQLQTTSERIDVSELADGIYIIKYGEVYKKLILSK